jgi:hypothetical protein
MPTRLLCFTMVLLLLGREPVFAQTSATMRIPLSRPTLTQSDILLFRNVLYSLTVTGRGVVGQGQSPPRTVDGRFFIDNSPLQGVPRPMMPLDANGTTGVQYCSGFTAIPGDSPCLIYLATNTTRTNPLQAAAQSADFRLSDAVQMRRFAFSPDRSSDVYNPNNRYFATVMGANLPMQAVFVDRLGFNGNMAYNDNSDTLSMRINRISPELVLSARPSFAVTSVQPARILNDDRPQQPFRDTVVDFGSLRPTSPLQIRRIVLFNRGLEPLAVRVEGNDPSNTFTVLSSRGDAGTQQFINPDGDSLVLSLTYQPRNLGTQTFDVRIITNDPALSAGGESVFRLRLVGAGAAGVLTVSGQIQNNTINFGTSIGIPRVRTFSVRNSQFQFVRAADLQVSFSIDSVVRTPNSPFGFAPFPRDPLNNLPLTIETVSSTSRPIFTPTRIGDYRDSIILRGQNLEDYTIYFVGRAELADAVIERTTPPIDEEFLDSGTLVTGSSATQSVLVRNVGNLPLRIRTFLDTGGDNREFTTLQETASLPETTGTSILIGVRYRANTEFPAGAKRGRLQIEVTSAITGEDVISRSYELRALRLPNVLAPARALVNFDSVYVGAERTDTTLIRNLSALHAATLQSQRIEALTATAGQAFWVTAFDTALIARRYGLGTSGQMRLRFRPQRLGLDSANVRLGSSVDSTGGAEELSVKLRGFGVRQQFDMESATADAAANSPIMPVQASFAPGGYRKFTVNIGCVRVGLSRTVRLAFRNNGNLPFAVWAQSRTLTGNAASDTAFRVVRNFTAIGAIGVGAVDSSLTVRFAPGNEGEKIFQYVLNSDIKRMGRIPTAPDSVEQVIVEIRGTGIVPNVNVQPSRVQFSDNPLGSGCTVQNTINVVITNPTTDLCGTPLSYKASILEAGTPFSLSLANISGTLAAAQSITLPVSFSPSNVSDYAATLLITTDAPRDKDTIRIPLQGRASAQPSVIVSAATVRASPGKIVSIPIFVRPGRGGSPTLNAEALRFVKVARFQLTFDKSLLLFERAITDLTASSNAIVPPPDTMTNADGTTTLTFTITARDSALRPRNETLVVLNFSTFLGRSITTTLKLDGISFRDSVGTSPCLRARLEGAAINGEFALDSVCGLAAKVDYVNKLNSTKTFLLSAITPNPVSDNVRVGFDVAYPAHVTVEILDALGQVKATVTDNHFPEGAFEGEINVGHLAPGVYFCRMRAERFSEMRKILIVR